MSFVRAKWIKGIVYHYLVENFREGDKVRQRVLAYLGEYRRVEDAHTYWSEQAKTAKDTAAKRHAREMAKKLEQYLKE